MLIDTRAPFASSTTVLSKTKVFAVARLLSTGAAWPGQYLTAELRIRVHAGYRGWLGIAFRAPPECSRAAAFPTSRAGGGRISPARTISARYTRVLPHGRAGLPRRCREMQTLSCGRDLVLCYLRSASRLTLLRRHPRPLYLSLARP